MKWLILRSVVCLCTFSIGVTVNLMLTANHHVSHTSKAEEIKLGYLDSTQMPIQPRSTLSALNLTYNYAPGKFNPSGDYHPLNRMKDASEKSIHFDLQVRRNKGKLVASGEIRNNGTYYKFASISITDRKLTFITINIRGVEYRFDGRFLGSGDFARQTMDEGQIMLEGRLQKFINGEKVAETVSHFLYFAGC